MGNNKTAPLGVTETKTEYKSTISNLEFWTWKSSETCFFVCLVGWLVFNSFGGAGQCYPNSTPFVLTLIHSGHTDNYGVQLPCPMGTAQESWFPEPPWDMELRSPSIGHPWHSSLSAHTCPGKCFSWEHFLIHHPHPLFGGPLLKNPSQDRKSDLRFFAAVLDLRLFLAFIYLT